MKHRSSTECLPAKSANSMTAELPEPAEYLKALRLDKEPELLRASLVAEKLGICRQSVYHLVACGELSAIRLGPSGLRIFKQSVIEYLKRQMLKPD